VSHPSRKIKERLIKEYLSTPEKRAKLASSMRIPLDTRIGFNGLWRRVFEREANPAETKVYDLTVWMDPEDPEAVDKAMNVANGVLVTHGDKLFLDRVRPPEEEWDVRTIEGPETFKAVLEEYREFASAPGSVLMDARTYAEVREHPGSYDEPEMPPIRGTHVDYAGMLGQMQLRVSRSPDPWEVFFVPRLAGRFFDRLTVESLDEPSGDGHPQFRVTLKLDLDGHPEKVKAVRFVYPEKGAE